MQLKQHLLLRKNDWGEKQPQSSQTGCYLLPMANNSDLHALPRRSSLEAGLSIGVQAMVSSGGWMVPMLSSQSQLWHPRKESVDTVSKVTSLPGDAYVKNGD